MIQVPIDPKTVRQQKTEFLILHEFNGRKYFEAFENLVDKRNLGVLKYAETSVLKLFVKSVFFNKLSFLQSFRTALRNLCFRLVIPFSRNKTIILGIPPWDFRMLWYGLLTINNRLIYHTSWPDWKTDAVPRRYGLFSRVFQWCWYRVLNSSNTQIVTVVSESAERLAEEFPHTKIDVIPHVVSEAFSKVSSNRCDNSFGILFVGELIEKKGVRLLPQISERLADLPVCFGIVGDGPLMPLVADLQDLPNVTVYGKISDREQLAAIYARHHALIVPSQKSSRWQELFGMVIIEAMAAGLPVIASNHIGPRSIVAHLEDGFLVPEQAIDKLEEYIRYLFNQPLLWQKMSANAKEKAKAYALETVESQWLELILSQ